MMAPSMGKPHVKALTNGNISFSSTGLIRQSSVLILVFAPLKEKGYGSPVCLQRHACRDGPIQKALPCLQITNVFPVSCDANGGF